MHEPQTNPPNPPNQASIPTVNPTRKYLDKRALLKMRTQSVYHPPHINKPKIPRSRVLCKLFSSTFQQPRHHLLEIESFPLLSVSACPNPHYRAAQPPRQVNRPPSHWLDRRFAGGLRASGNRLWRVLGRFEGWACAGMMAVDVSWIEK